VFACSELQMIATKDISKCLNMDGECLGYQLC